MLLLDKLVALVDDVKSALSNFSLLSLVERGVIILVKVVERLVHVGSRGGHLSRWDKESVLSLTESILALRLNMRLGHGHSRNLRVLIKSGSWQLLALIKRFILHIETLRHGVVEIHGGKRFFVGVPSWPRSIPISMLSNIFNKESSHIVSSKTHAELLVRLQGCLAEGVA